MRSASSRVGTLVCDMENFRIDDESGDRKYFTMVPNYVLNHSGAIEQGLYLQMKRYAGENGSCFASRHTLCKKLKIGTKTYRAALNYLIEHEWIYLKGKQLVETPGGPQLVNVYGVKDLWKLNSDYYSKGGAESVYPFKGGAESNEGGAKRRKGGAESTPKKNILKTNEEEDHMAWKKYNEGKHYEEDSIQMDELEGVPEVKNATPSTVSFMSLFRDINPMWKDWFRKPAQHQSARQLLELHDFTWWKDFMPKYKQWLETDQYATKATSPFEMVQKIAAIEITIKAKLSGEKNKQKIWL